MNAQFAYLLDVSELEGRHWNNDGVMEDITTGSAAGAVGAYLTKHGRAGPLLRPPERDPSADRGRSKRDNKSTHDVALVGRGILNALPEAEK